MSRFWAILAIILGIVFGVATALFWVFGFAPFIRVMLPYAIIAAVIIAAATALVSAKNGLFRSECPHVLGGCAPKLFTAIILISAALAVLTGLIILATILPLVLKVIFAFIGAVSFWTSIIAFVFYIVCLARRPVL